MFLFDFSVNTMIYTTQFLFKLNKFIVMYYWDNLGSIFQINCLIQRIQGLLLSTVNHESALIRLETYGLWVMRIGLSKYRALIMFTHTYIHLASLFPFTFSPSLSVSQFYILCVNCIYDNERTFKSAQYKMALQCTVFVLQCSVWTWGLFQ